MVEPGDILLGHHEIRKLAGHAGMADVYLASDRWRRAAAVVKVPNEDLAKDPEFVRRFECEAEALAQLNHPNIVRFYGIEQQVRVAFIVKDYIVLVAAI
jgi:eukaryotic-like serine/threonine-protein kinase